MNWLKRFRGWASRPRKSALVANILLPYFFIAFLSWVAFLTPFNTSAYKGVGLVVFISTIVSNLYLAAVQLPKIRYALPFIYWCTITLILPTIIINLARLDLVISTLHPHSFNIVLTRIDALYFAVTTLTTVGYGDIYPITEQARGFVMLQMFIGFVFVAVVVVRLVSPDKDGRWNIDLNAIVESMKQNKKNQ